LYTTPDCAHWRNNTKFRARGLARRNQAPPPAPISPRDMGKKFMQFAVVFYLLRRGRPLADYSKLYNLFDFLKIDKPKKHWSEPSGWQINAESLTHVLDSKLKEEVGMSP
jgi:hypothetical protein